ncbi:hypothetical protein H5410_028887 [Solanum commersonii]|uniref:Uncharacterized protein n=1 Tax=Solanum commersonii TaxID=4109 RepID=A0A9J5Z370_SOLCO|nr:hypothetical protein H5410_028887 [Solanum commersonii]
MATSHDEDSIKSRRIEQWRPHFNLRGVKASVWRKRVATERFEEDEVTETLKLCSGDKARGGAVSDEFLSKLREMLKEDILSTLRQFHDHRVFEKSLNATMWH